jgi:hypothetical protein
MRTDDELVAQAKALDHLLMKPMFVFRMASARLNGPDAPHVKGYKAAARKQQVEAAVLIDTILEGMLDP